MTKIQSNFLRVTTIQSYAFHVCVCVALKWTCKLSWATTTFSLNQQKRGSSEPHDPAQNKKLLCSISPFLPLLVPDPSHRPKFTCTLWHTCQQKAMEEKRGLTAYKRRQSHERASWVCRSHFLLDSSSLCDQSTHRQLPASSFILSTQRQHSKAMASIFITKTVDKAISLLKKNGHPERIT